MYFESFVCGPDKFIYRLNFLFQLMEKVLFYASGVLFFFLECYFLSIVSMELV